MEQQNLWLECSNLTHHSLQAFLMNVIQRPHILNLYQFLSHPKIGTVNEQVLKLYKAFVYKNYNSISQDVKKDWSNKQHDKLKKLTILSQFQALNEISISRVQEVTQSSRQEVIKLLMEMSISGLIDIKIDEKRNIIQIHYSQIRARSFNQNQTQSLEGSISRIIQKNSQILRTIQSIKDSNKKIESNKMEAEYSSPKFSYNRENPLFF